jgi:hypothetical protein
VRLLDTFDFRPWTARKTVSMKRKFLGDAYDLAKRFILDSTRPISEVFCIPMFTDFPENEKEMFSRLIGVPIIKEQINDVNNDLYGKGVFLDPNTGITDEPSREHVSFDQIAFLLEKGAKFVIVFDQSFVRKKDKSKKEQVIKKLEKLQRKKIEAFYYVSHASFLFASKNRDTATQLKEQLLKRGIPEDKFIAAQ